MNSVLSKEYLLSPWKGIGSYNDSISKQFIYSTIDSRVDGYTHVSTTRKIQYLKSALQTIIKWKWKDAQPYMYKIWFFTKGIDLNFAQEPKLLKIKATLEAKNNSTISTQFEIEVDYYIKTVSVAYLENRKQFKDSLFITPVYWLAVDVSQIVTNDSTYFPIEILYEDIDTIWNELRRIKKRIIEICNCSEHNMSVRAGAYVLLDNFPSETDYLLKLTLDYFKAVPSSNNIKFIKFICKHDTYIPKFYSRKELKKSIRIMTKQIKK